MGVERTCHQILTCGRRLAYLKWVIKKKPMDQSAGERGRESKEWHGKCEEPEKAA